MEQHSVAIITILIMEVSVYIISFLRFGRETCTHAFLSKMWGLSLLIAFTSLIGFAYAGVPFMIAIVLGLISHIDRILITLILPRWTHDVPSAYHAYLIRKGKKFKKGYPKKTTANYLQFTTYRTTIAVNYIDSLTLKEKAAQETLCFLCGLS